MVKARRPAAVLLLFSLLLGTWLLLSQRFEVLFIAMGVVSAGISTALTYPLVLPIVFPDRRPERGGLVRLGHVVRYLGWVLRRMTLASVQIAYFVLHPRMPLDPAVLRFTTTLRTPMARAVIANTITLIPGTMTVDLDGDEYAVHTFFPAAADDIVSGELQERVAAMFGEATQGPVEPRWDPPREDRP